MSTLKRTDFFGRTAWLISGDSTDINSPLSEFSASTGSEFAMIVQSGHKGLSGEPLWLLVYETAQGINSIDNRYPMTIQKIGELLNIKNLKDLCQI